ncbi:50S ribosomal protein L30 [Serinibacter arcticus]|uniref:Large ribosomal subunit protein uL30 n=1 Tax=Serinibacter arcticus TaxID=1655435 RepID=A0A2U1ZTZ5_9MICO|nr:50S ribosomal protein L30 [Serinibacter arcticus]PWD50455.1 50S ribosomal protein L30 [Serinibacter arcticus]
MAQLQVTQTRSAIGGKQNQRETLRTLGLGKIGRVTVREDNAQVRGMIQVVNHLVKVEEVD